MTTGAVALEVRKPTVAPARPLHLRLPLLILLVVTASNAANASALAGIPIYLGALGLASGTLVLLLVTGRVHLRAPRVVLLFAFGLACAVPSVVAAQDGQAAWTAYSDNLKDLWFLFVVVLLGAAVSNALSVARVVTGVVAVLAGLTVLNEFVLGNSVTFGGFSVLSASEGVGTTIPRQAGPFEDPNFYGRVLVLVFPLAVALAYEAWTRRAPRVCAVWAVGSILLVGGVYLTGSRGAMIALVLAAVVWMVVAGPGPRRALVILPALAVLAAFLPGVGSRLVSLTDLSPDTASFAELDGSLVERVAAQKVMWAIFADHPLVGIGPENAALVWSDYATAGDGGIKRVVAPHNLYLQVAAETGVLGLLGWLVFLFGVILVARWVVLANPVAPRAPPSRDRLLATGVIAGLAGWMTTSMFLHLADLRLLLIVVAIVGIIATRRPAPAAHRGNGTFPLPRNLFVWVTALVVLVGGGLIGYRALQPQRWVAEITVTLVPTPSASGGTDPFRQSVIQRRRVVATYAAVFERVGQPLLPPGNVRLAVVAPRASTGSAVDPIFLVRVQGAGRPTVEQLAREVADRGRAYVGTTPVLSTFATAQVGSITSTPLDRWSLSFP